MRTRLALLLIMACREPQGPTDTGVADTDTGDTSDTSDTDTNAPPSQAFVLAGHGELRGLYAVALDTRTFVETAVPVEADDIAVAVGGKLFLLGSSGVRGYAPDDLSAPVLTWSWEESRWPAGSVTCEGAALLAAYDDPMLLAFFDADTGERRGEVDLTSWDAGEGESVYTSPISLGDTIYVSVTSGIVAIDCTTFAADLRIPLSESTMVRLHENAAAPATAFATTYDDVRILDPTEPSLQGPFWEAATVGGYIRRAYATPEGPRLVSVGEHHALSDSEKSSSRGYCLDAQWTELGHTTFAKGLAADNRVDIRGMDDQGNAWVGTSDELLVVDVATCTTIDQVPIPDAVSFLIP